MEEFGSHMKELVSERDPIPVWEVYRKYCPLKAEERFFEMWRSDDKNFLRPPKEVSNALPVFPKEQTHVWNFAVSKRKPLQRMVDSLEPLPFFFTFEIHGFHELSFRKHKIKCHMLKIKVKDVSDPELRYNLFLRLEACFEF